MTRACTPAVAGASSLDRIRGCCGGHKGGRDNTEAPDRSFFGGVETARLIPARESFVCCRVEEKGVEARAGVLGCHWGVRGGTTTLNQAHA
jgi:hypothetical protein